MLARRHTMLLAAICTTAACSPDKVSAPPACETSTALTLDPLAGGVVASPSVCAQLSATQARYFVAAQYATQASKPAQTAFKLASGDGTVAMSIRAPITQTNALYTDIPSTSMQRQVEFDTRLRDLERDIPLSSFERASGSKVAMARSPLTPPDSLHNYNVLTTTSGGKFVLTQGRLRYAGQRVYIYEDTGSYNSFTDSAYAALGRLFDDVLYPIDTAAFGSPSDQDGNEHIVVFLSQQINKLTPSADCATKGFVAGYFYGYDLSTGANANRGEIFYSIAPDPTGQYSCAHSAADVLRLTPATFIHEFQHMISYNQHVLVRGSPSEVTWLNEGLSHIAEELGGKYYEAKYPAPLGRTNASQLFPDSALSFVVPQFRNAYAYLQKSTTQSVTTFEGLGTLEERGAAWLFLRWLADQKGEGIFRQLVQTNQTGITNVANKANEAFPGLFGDFGIATYTDSITGVPRSSVPIRYRFTTRNTRQVFGYYFPIKPNPITPTAVACNSSVSGSMLQGTSSYFLVGGSAGCASARISLGTSNGSAITSALAPQVAIFRLP